MKRLVGDHKLCIIIFIIIGVTGMISISYLFEFNDQEATTNYGYNAAKLFQHSKKSFRSKSR